MKIYAHCEDCDYETEVGEDRDVFYQVCIDGGYIRSDKEGGYDSECPKCGSGNLSISD